VYVIHLRTIAVMTKEGHQAQRNPQTGARLPADLHQVPPISTFLLGGGNVEYTFLHNSYFEICFPIEYRIYMFYFFSSLHYTRRISYIMTKIPLGLIAEFFIGTEE
jgi:hypothetical protein